VVVPLAVCVRERSTSSTDRKGLPIFSVSCTAFQAGLQGEAASSAPCPTPTQGRLCRIHQDEHNVPLSGCAGLFNQMQHLLS
jgi:hypothetical protein